MGQGGYQTFYDFQREQSITSVEDNNGRAASSLQDQPEIIELLTDTSGEKEQ